MGINTRKWINAHREELKRKYPNKTVIVCENKVIKVLDDPIDPIEINRIARKLCKGKEWSYTYLEEKEEYML
jgi:uncharacterized protein (DUF2267 family)